MSKIKKVSKGILDGLNDDEQPQKNKRIKEEKSKDVEEKCKRSYMLPPKTIRKLEMVKIQETGITLSELVKEAIDLLYEERVKE